MAILLNRATFNVFGVSITIWNTKLPLTGEEIEADIGFGDCVNRQLFGVITKNDFEEPQILEVEGLPTNQKFESSNQCECSRKFCFGWFHFYGAMLLLKRIVLELRQRLTIGLVNCSKFSEVFEVLDVHCKCVHCTVYVQS